MLDDEHEEEKVNQLGSKGEWTWKVVKAVIDSGTIDHVGNPEDFPGMKVVPTEGSRRGERWVAAGGAPIQKLGEMYIPWETDSQTIQATPAPFLHGVYRAY